MFPESPFASVYFFQVWLGVSDVCELLLIITSNMQITKLLRCEFIKNIASLSCSSFLDEENDDTVITDTTESEYISSNDDENVENVKKKDNDDIFRPKATKIRYFLMKSFN